MLEDAIYRPGEERSVTSHGKLPHWHQDGVYVFVTWQLADAAPRNMLAHLALARQDAAILRRAGAPDAEVERRVRAAERRVEKYLDSADGGCLLRQSRAAQIVADALLHFNNERYVMDCFVIMPNHVHLLMRLDSDHPLPTVAQSWKSFTAKVLAKEFGLGPNVWHRGYWDQLIRSGRHLRAVRNYIAANPSKSRLEAGEYIYWEAPERVAVE